MKNNRIVFIISILFCNITFIFGQQDDCTNCPSCYARLTKGQETLSNEKNALKNELETLKRRLGSTVDKSELDRSRGESNRLAGENQNLKGEISSKTTEIEGLKAEISNLKGQIQTKSTELTTTKSEAERKQEEAAKYRDDAKRLENSQSGERGILCITPWLNDRISKATKRIIFFNETYNFNLYEKNDAKSELCFITFEGNTTKIKQVRVGKDILTDPDGIKCLLNRINNLYYHYQDEFHLRIQIKYRDGKSTAAKDQYNSIQSFFRVFFAQDRKTEGIEGARKFTIFKWGRSDENGISISISANEEDSDKD